MYAQVEKPIENKSRAAANSVTQKKSGGRQKFGFVDNRPEVVAQRKLFDEVNEHPMQKKENNTKVDSKSGGAKSTSRVAEDVQRNSLEGNHIGQMMNDKSVSSVSSVVQCIGRIIIDKKDYQPAEAAEMLLKSGEAGGRTHEQIMKVLTHESLPDSEMTFRSLFALGWFVERQHDRISGLAEQMMPRHINSIYDLEQTLDYICGNRWWYVGGYAALLWMRNMRLEQIPTDDLDIAIGGEHEHAAVMGGFPEALWREHTQTVEGYTVQFIGRSSAEPAQMHRFGSSNVLIPEIIIQGYSAKDTEAQLVKGPMGIGGLAAMVAAAAREKQGLKAQEESQEKQEKRAKREMRVKLLNSILREY